MTNGVRIVSGAITVILALLTYAVTWVTVYTAFAAPIWGSMAVNFMAVIILAVIAFLLAVYTILMGIATLGLLDS